MIGREPPTALSILALKTQDLERALLGETAPRRQEEVKREIRRLRRRRRWLEHLIDTGREP